MRVVVELAARKFALPFECPCCGAQPDTDIRVTARISHQGVDFPICQRCKSHVTRWEAAAVQSAGIMVLAILAVLIIAIAWSLLVALLVFIAAASLAWWLRQARRAAAKAKCGPSCASPDLAVAYHGFSGATSAFSFASPTFAARFAEHNTALLTNVSGGLRKLLDGYRKARLAVPTPAAAAGVVPPPLTVRDWIARIESTEGVVARRVALQRALEMIEATHQRRELIQTLARIELAPLLDKLQRLSSPAAKKSHLEKSIERIRADNISDELQEVELAQLQERLAAL